MRAEYIRTGKEVPRRLYLHNVANWWRGKLIAGTQLTIPGYPVPRWDVCDDGPWHRWVATEAIINDLEQRTGMQADKTLFDKAFRITTGQSKREQRRAYWPIRKDVHRMEFRQFIRFDPLDACKALITDHSGMWQTVAHNRSNEGD